MKTFVICAFGVVAAFMVATYRPVSVCEQSQAKTSVVCSGAYCVAETERPSVICHESHL